MSKTLKTPPRTEPKTEPKTEPRTEEEKAKILESVIATVHRLRAPGGCPWDRAQTHQTLRPYVIEEAYEVLDVLDRIASPDDLQDERIQQSFREELGDLLMQVLLHSEMTAEEGAFDFYDVARGLEQKLIHRHPHVFGDQAAQTVDAVLLNWEKRKAEEKKARGETSVLDGLPKGLPALQKTSRIIEKVTRVGFQWGDLGGPLAKLDEELQEFKAEVAQGGLKPDPAQLSPEQKQKISDELGDLLFSLCNVAHFLKISPEDALRGTLGRFERRFRHVENRLAQAGKKPEQSSLEEMDRYWNEAKESEGKDP